MEKPYFLILAAGLAFYCIRCTSPSYEYNKTEVQSIVSLGEPIAFPNTEIETKSVSKTLIISNTGNKPLTITRVTSSDAAFTVLANENKTVAPQGSVDVQIQFAPAREQDYSATITVESDASRGENTTQVTGAGVDYHKSVLSVTGEPAFGEVALGKSAKKLIKIANTGNEPFDITNITSSDPAFTLLNVARKTMAPGSTLDVEIQFTPTEAKSYSATITIENNADQGKNTLEATGTGISRGIISLEGNLDFANVGVGKSAKKTFKVSNTGNKDLNITEIVSSNPAFTILNSGIKTLIPGGSALIKVQFKPTEVQGYLATITVVSDAAEGENTIPASGAGIKRKSIISLGKSLNFGSVAIGESAKKTLTISNKGDKQFEVSGITFPAAVYTADRITGTVDAGGSITITVTFQPKNVQSYNGVVTVAHNADSGKSTLLVIGSGHSK